LIKKPLRLAGLQLLTSIVIGCRGKAPFFLLKDIYKLAKVSVLDKKSAIKVAAAKVYSYYDVLLLIIFISKKYNILYTQILYNNERVFIYMYLVHTRACRA
jgi:hypothetical protein